jgi:hypothetical protein
VRQHVAVHRRRNEHGGLRGQVQRRKEVVGNAVGELADHVRRARCHEQQRNFIRNGDVLDVRIRTRIPLRCDHWPARDGLEGDRPDEAGRCPRHHRHDIVPPLLQSTTHLDRLVGADAAGDAEGDEGHVSRLLSFVDLDDFAPKNFLLRDCDFLVAFLTRRCARQQLARTLARKDDEFEPVFLRCSFHSC